MKPSHQTFATSEKRALGLTCQARMRDADKIDQITNLVPSLSSNHRDASKSTPLAPVTEGISWGSLRLSDRGSIAPGLSNHITHHARFHRPQRRPAHCECPASVATTDESNNYAFIKNCYVSKLIFKKSTGDIVTMAGLCAR